MFHCENLHIDQKTFPRFEEHSKIHRVLRMTSGFCPPKEIVNNKTMVKNEHKCTYVSLLHTYFERLKNINVAKRC